MIPADDIAARILKMAARSYGTSRRQVRDSFAPASRDRGMRVLAALLKTGELTEFTRTAFGKCGGRNMRRLFVDPKAGTNWQAGLVVVPESTAPKRRMPRLERGDKVQGGIPAAVVCPSGTDHRYTVHALPQGYRSALDPNECRPWANVAAMARASA